MISNLNKIEYILGVMSFKYGLSEGISNASNCKLK